MGVHRKQNLIFLKSNLNDISNGTTQEVIKNRVKLYEK